MFSFAALITPNYYLLEVYYCSGHKQNVTECVICNDPSIFFFTEPRTEILGEKELFVDYASSLNLTCLVKSPDPPDYIFWKKDDQVGRFSTLNSKIHSCKKVSVPISVNEVRLRHNTCSSFQSKHTNFYIFSCIISKVFFRIIINTSF